ncbi:MAG: aminoacetone oxidase family FAD-binding enzyme [Lachnospiraceae bacterium]|nr:aminoacetone oxidase family FAD-binding enzyme [Lachnospiraceae bacterium]
MVYDLIIIGAGASGLAAACKGICLNPKLNILVLEKESLPGRKLSEAGNGKCNLTNSDFRNECYHSENSDFVRNWMSQHSFQEIPDFLKELGILLYQKDGYYYPMSNQGKQVTNLLYEKSHQMGVTFLFETRATELRAEEADGKPLYHIQARKGEEHLSLHARYLLLATGGMASPKLGGCQDGYRFGKQLGLRQHACYPVLSPIYVSDPMAALAKGVRLDAVVTLKTDTCSVRESGQVQFNENSLSGIVILNLSCYLNRHRSAGWQECLWIDTLPALSWEQLKGLLLSQRERVPQYSLSLVLSGILPNAFVRYIMKRLQLEPSVRMNELTEKQLNRLTSSLKKLTFTPIDQEDYDKAQVTGGGIATEEVDVSSFECKKYRNLYITGEVLDVNGRCGGYNLTFAILSGLQAAEHIGKKIHN